MILFRWVRTKKSHANGRRAVDKSVLVDRSASAALTQYRKTFLDLARYDRGERVSLPR